MKIMDRATLMQMSQAIQRALGLVWQAAPGWMLLWGTLLCVQGLLPVGILLLTAQAINHLVIVTQQPGQWGVMQAALFWLVPLGVLMVLNQLLVSASQWVRTMQTQKVQDSITQLIHQKAMIVDYAFYESSEYYHRLYRAQMQAKNRPLALLETLGALLKNSITLCGIGGVLITLGWELVSLLLITLAPVGWVSIRQKQRERQWQLQITPLERKAWYFDQVLTQKAYAAELRLFNLGAYFSQQYQAARAEWRSRYVHLQKQQIGGQLGMTLLMSVGGMIAAVVLLWQVFQGRLSMGEWVMLYQAFTRGQAAVRSLLVSGSEIYGHHLFLQDLFEFLDSQSQLSPPVNLRPVPTVLTQGIRFEQVYFRYPGSAAPALTAFNLAIPAGTMVAIVGANGAGKSTLFKLLCCLYEPDQGRITLEGHDLREFDPIALRRQISLLLQEPVRYQATIAENIRFGDLICDDDDALQSQRLQQAAAAAAVDEWVQDFPQRYDTLLGKWLEEGTELSGGQWQRLALARAFYRQAAIILLDEPTSAMDAWAEADWLARFRVLVQGKIALIITHRFTTARYADQIVVLDAGTVIEMGTHEQLLAQNGRYAQSWREQVAQIQPN